MTKFIILKFNENYDIDLIHEFQDFMRDWAINSWCSFLHFELLITEAEYLFLKNMAADNEYAAEYLSYFEIKKYINTDLY